MGTTTITGNDTLVLNGRVFNDLSLGDVTAITFPNDLVTRKSGKNGNAIFAENAPGENSDLMIRVVRGSGDDQFLLTQLASQIADLPSAQLLNGSFTKRLGDGSGNVANDKYTLAGGMIAKIPDGKENVDGDTSQGEAVYKIIFTSTQRLIQ